MLFQMQSNVLFKLFRLLTTWAGLNLVIICTNSWDCYKWYRTWRAEHPEFEKIVFHGLRHFGATYQLIISGGDMKTVRRPCKWRIKRKNTMSLTILRVISVRSMDKSITSSLAGFRTSEQTPFYIEMGFTMNKLLSCRYNMDTNRVEARFEDGTTLAIDCIAVEDEYGNTTAQRAELDWLLYNKPLEYAQLVLGGKIEHYLSLGCDHGRLED